MTTRTLWNDLTLATLRPEDGVAVVEDAAIAVADGRIAFAGRAADLPADWRDEAPEGLGGRLVTPAMIDCHTHLVHGGDRAREFEMRLEGASYEEIARAGGGIVSSVRATRELGVEGLVRTALPRLDALLSEGVSTVEIKSGYGLEVATELDMLRAARRLERERPVRVRTTWLAAHATPAEYKGRNDDYIRDVVLPGMEQGAAEGLIDAVDGFLRGHRLLAGRDRRGLRQGEGARPAGEAPCRAVVRPRRREACGRLRALSADHLEYLGADGIDAMAGAGTVAVLLPGAFYAIRETRVPPVAALRAAGVPMAVATDCNPAPRP